MNVDSELELWRQQWQAQPAVPADLRRTVERQSRNIRLMLIADILVTVIIGGYTLWLAIATGRSSFIVLAIATWIFIGAAWAFAVKNRRGAWNPAAETTVAFLDISVRRSQARLRAVWFGAGLYVCETLFCLAWIFHERAKIEPLTLGEFMTSWPVSIVLIITVGFAILLKWYQGRQRREMARLLEMRRELGEA